MKKGAIFLLLWLLFSLLYVKGPSVQRLANIFFNFWQRQGIASFVLPSLLLAGISAYFLNILIWAMIEQKISRTNIIIFYVLYFAFMIYTLLLRRAGTYGINLNPLNTFQVYQDPIVLTLNLIAFAPIGFVLKFSWRNLLFMAILIALIELTQYFLKIGFCDIDDWVQNIVGYLLGTQVIKIFRHYKIAVK